MAIDPGLNLAARGASEAPAPRQAPAAPTPIVDPGAAVEAARIAAARRDPIWRCQVALADACRRAGVPTAPLSDAAARAEVQAWIDHHRAALRERAA